MSFLVKRRITNALAKWCTCLLMERPIFKSVTVMKIPSLPFTLMPSCSSLENVLSPLSCAFTLPLFTHPGIQAVNNKCQSNQRVMHFPLVNWFHIIAGGKFQGYRTHNFPHSKNRINKKNPTPHLSEFKHMHTDLCPRAAPKLPVSCEQ